MRINFEASLPVLFRFHANLLIIMVAMSACMRVSMNSFTVPFIASRRWLRQLLPLSALVVLALLAGCQEDFRATKTSTTRASERADSRLDKATGSLLETFGKPDSENQRTPVVDKSQKSTKPHALTWSAPLTREDGSSLALSQIAGFRIYYRLRHQEKYDVISISNPTTSHYPLERLPPGAYEFSITTVDDNGLESRRSDPVTADLI